MNKEETYYRKIIIILAIPFALYSYSIKSEYNTEYDKTYEQYSNNYEKWSSKFPTVCITYSGYAYHRCYHYKDSNSPMNLYDADRSRTPCEKCRPPRIENYEHLITNKPKFQKPDKPFFLFRFYIIICILSIVFLPDILRSNNFSEKVNEKYTKIKDQIFDKAINQIPLATKNSTTPDEYWETLLRCNRIINHLEKTDYESKFTKQLFTYLETNDLISLSKRFKRQLSTIKTGTTKATSLYLWNLKPKNWNGFRELIYSGKLSDITYISLSNNNLDDLQQLGIESLNLKMISIRNNKLRTLNNLSNAEFLEDLDVTENQIIDLNGLKEYSMIESLSLEKNVGLKYDGIENLHKLKYLNICGKSNMQTFHKISSLNNVNQLRVSNASEEARIIAKKYGPKYTLVFST